MKKQEIFMIGNAHLDPAWVWSWQEGSCEAKATIRSALDRMKEFPDFKFVCSSSSVYQWIEDFDPEMFEEMKVRVKEGRFIIVGGWKVQPDCNLPSGENFARNSLYSQRYFFENFGKTSKVGYNVDSFGHNAMMPQILRKSGMKYYVYMRPMEWEKSMQENVFTWQSPDGSRVTAFRINQEYCKQFNSMDVLEDYLADCKKFYKGKSFMGYYGVGNHGGGPTIKNIQMIEEYNERADGEFHLTMADPVEYFEKIEKECDLSSKIFIDPYTLIPSAVLAIDGVVLKQSEEMVDNNFKHALNPLSSKARRAEVLLNNEYLENIFQYPSEQEIIQTGFTQRNMTKRFENLIERIDILKHRERSSADIFVEFVLCALAVFESIGILNSVIAGNVRIPVTAISLFSVIFIIETVKWIKTRVG